MNAEDIRQLGRQLVDIADNFPGLDIRPMSEEYKASLSGHWEQFPNACAIGNFVIIPRADFEKPKEQ